MPWIRQLTGYPAASHPWLPYKRGEKARTREMGLEASNFAVVGYDRVQVLAEKVVLPVRFSTLDDEPETGGRIRVPRWPSSLTGLLAGQQAWRVLGCRAKDES